MKYQKDSISFFIVLIDILTVALVSVSAGYILLSSKHGMHAGEFQNLKLYAGMAAIAAWVAGGLVFRLYRADRGFSIASEAALLLPVGIAAGAAYYFVLTLIGGYSDILPVLPQVSAAYFVIALAGRRVFRSIMEKMRRSGRNHLHALMVGWDSESADFLKKINESHPFEIVPIGVFDVVTEKNGLPDYVKYIRSVEELESYLLHPPVIDMVIAAGDVRSQKFADEALEICRVTGTGIVVPEESAYTNGAGTRIVDFYGSRLKTIDVPTVSESVIKKVFDMVVAGVLLVFLSPLMLLISLAIMITSPGAPVFYTQTRTGMHGRPFDIFKFRTMVKNADELKEKLKESNIAQEPLFKVPNDPRITPLGRFLRRFALDELPQLLNVLRGDMSLVGPRPYDQKEAMNYELSDRERLAARPGLTGLGQIMGGSMLPFKESVAYDVEYIKKWNFMLDISIMVKTIPFIVTKGTVQ